MRILDKKITLFQLIMTLSDAIDLVSPTVSGHHKRVSYIATSLAEEMKLSDKQKKELVLAAAIHDIGAFSVKERVKALEFDIGPKAVYHAEIGYFMLKDFFHLKDSALLIRYHHHKWGKNELSVSAGILSLADRVDVSIDFDREILSQRKEIINKIKDRSETEFMPEAVEALESIAKRESFWFDIKSNRMEDRLESIAGDYTIELDSEDLFKLARILSRIIDFRSSFTISHSAGVSVVAKELARLKGFADKQLFKIELAGFLHDIGKIAVPAWIINKDGELKQEEYNIIKQHPFYTYRILDRIEGLGRIKDWAGLHHEKLDGSGYPFKLSEENLSLGTQIVAIADLFTALSEDRPYRKGMKGEKIKGILKSMAKNNKINAELVDLLVTNYKKINDLREGVQQEEKEMFDRLKKFKGV